MTQPNKETATPSKLPINTHRRLFDLVRYMRAELHEDNIVTDEEYGWLCSHEFPEDKGKPGSPSPRRLEDYDDLATKLSAQASTLEELRGDISRALRLAAKSDSSWNDDEDSAALKELSDRYPPPSAD